MTLPTSHRFWASLTVATAVAGFSLAQRTVPTVSPPSAIKQQQQESEDQEVLARGPVHEAYATTAEVPMDGGPILDKRPPETVEELPPDQKPEGDNVQWIPGYWHYDEERKDFIWISGFWRNAPPGRVWMPGSWREVRKGWQWTPGFWNEAKAEQAEFEYLPPPPETIDEGPSVPAPTETCFYTPGTWVYRTNRFRWRPGFWVEHRRDWIWVPDHYRWTPLGHVFVAGYWDEPLAQRGLLFAPVYFRPALLARPRFVYTPSYIVSNDCLTTSLFVRRGHCSYYFGDYFEQRYINAGFNSWCSAGFRSSNFAINVNFGRQAPALYDPLWSYYALHHRNTPTWQANLANVYVGRFNGDVPRPPRTLVQQNTIVNNVTNVNNITNNNVTNNNITVVNTKVDNRVTKTNVVAPQVLLASLDQARTAAPEVKLQAIKADDRNREQKMAKELVQLSMDRRKVETSMYDKGLVVTKDDKPRQLKLDVPQNVTARAKLPTNAEKAPPPPATAAQRSLVPVDQPGLKQPTIEAPVSTGRPNRGPSNPAPVINTPSVQPKPVEQQKPAVVTPTPIVNPVKPTERTKPVEQPKPTIVNPAPVVNPVKPAERTKPVEQQKPAIVTPVKPPVSNPAPVVTTRPDRGRPVEQPKPAPIINKPIEQPKPAPITVDPPKQRVQAPAPKPAPVVQAPAPKPAMVVQAPAPRSAPVVQAPAPKPAPAPVVQPQKPPTIQSNVGQARPNRASTPKDEKKKK